MLTFILRRCASAIVVLLLLLAALFVLQHLSPADPVRASVGNKASAATIAAARHELGYDRPLVVQFWSYLVDISHFDFQQSLRTKNPVSTDIVNSLPATIELLVGAAILALIGGFCLGLLTIRPGRAAASARTAMLAAASVPSFLLAILLVLLFYGQLGWLPGSGETSFDGTPTGPTKFLILDAVLNGQMDVFFDALKHLILPSLALATGPSVAIGRAFSSALTVTMRADYVKTARMKGLNDPALLVRHVVRNCMNSTLAMTGLQLGVMLASVTIVESVFAWPGVGQYLALSIGATDLPAILAVAMVIGAIFIITNTIVDVLQALADPRIVLHR
jgi:peptide/nickel transport system permease protein